MVDRQRPSPFFVEILADETPVAVMRLVFRAEETRALKHLRFEAMLDLPFRHQPQKALLVCPPIALFFLVRFEHRVGRREQRLVQVLNASDLSKEVGKIVRLGEARELRCVVQPDIDDLLDAGPQKTFEKSLCVGLSESDCRNVCLAHNRHSAAIDPRGRGCGSTNATFRPRSR